MYVVGVAMAEKIQGLEDDYPHVCLVYVVMIIQAETILKYILMLVVWYAMGWYDLYYNYLDHKWLFMPCGLQIDMVLILFLRLRDIVSDVIDLYDMCSTGLLGSICKLMHIHMWLDL